MNKESKGMTFTVIFEAESANYSDSVRNESVLKKMTREDQKSYTYISRQALRYSIINALNWDNTPVEAKGAGESTVVQFDPNATIKDYPEIDLFGYMKTVSKKEDSDSKGAVTRNAVVRLSNAISLESYKGDSDYLTNMGLAKRQNLGNNIAKSEIHRSFYTYTIAIDLDLVGIDKDIEINDNEKAERINKLLEVIEYLYRDIRGRRENLAPIFIIGGLYKRKNPFFEHRISLKDNNLELGTILDILEDEDIKNHTHIGLLKGIFANETEIFNNLKAKSIKETFDTLKNEVNEYYN